MPYDLPMQQCGGGLLSGLIVLNSSFSLWQLLVVLAVIAIGLFMYYSARPRDADGQSSAGDGGDGDDRKNLRQLTLDGIKTEVSRERKPAEFERAPGSEEAYLGEPTSDDK